MLFFISVLKDEELAGLLHNNSLISFQLSSFGILAFGHKLKALVVFFFPSQC